MKRLAGASESLTNALRKPVVRGSWGEMTLENALESAGLQPEIDFVLQHTTDAEDGRKRTDAIINLPKGRKLVIDSKNLMDSYIALANTEDEVQKAALAELHSKSLKAHIKGLSAKEYWRRYEGLDCVILFIPHDGTIIDQLLGHSRRDVLRFYTARVLENLRDAILRLDQLRTAKMDRSITSRIDGIGESASNRSIVVN